MLFKNRTSTTTRAWKLHKYDFNTNNDADISDQVSSSPSKRPRTTDTDTTSDADMNSPKKIVMLRQRLIPADIEIKIEQLWEAVDNSYSKLVDRTGEELCNAYQQLQESRYFTGLDVV